MPRTGPGGSNRGCPPIGSRWPRNSGSARMGPRGCRESATNPGDWRRFAAPGRWRGRAVSRPGPTSPGDDRGARGTARPTPPRSTGRPTSAGRSGPRPGRPGFLRNRIRPWCTTDALESQRSVKPIAIDPERPEIRPTRRSRTGRRFTSPGLHPGSRHPVPVLIGILALDVDECQSSERSLVGPCFPVAFWSFCKV